MVKFFCEWTTLGTDTLMVRKRLGLMKTSLHDVRSPVTANEITGWVKLVFLAWCLVAAGTSPAKPMPIALPAAATGVEIQAALDGLPAIGGEVILPAGTFEVSEPIVLSRDNLTLRGTGEKTILHLADNANCPVVILGEPVNAPSRTIRHLRVAGFFVDGNRAHQQRELWRLAGEGSEIRNNGLIVQGVSDSVVENVTCARCRSGGLVTTLGVQRLTVRNLTAFDNEFDGLACYLTSDSLFTGLNLHNNPCAGISLDLAFNHNIISNAILAANDLGIFMRASCENQFYDVTIRDCLHHGVFMAHAEAPRTECADNAFTNLAAANCGAAAFRVNNITCTNNVLIRARFEGNVHGGISQVQPDLLTVR